VEPVGGNKGRRRKLVGVSSLALQANTLAKLICLLFLKEKTEDIWGYMDNRDHGIRRLVLYKSTFNERPGQ
jgi:hypothetical protein